MEESYSYYEVEDENGEDRILGQTESFEIPEENYPEELEYYKDISSIDSTTDEPQIDLTDKIKEVERLRIVRDQTIERKNNLMVMLVELFQEGLCQTEVPIRAGNDKELAVILGKLLVEFKQKKELAVKRFNKIKQKMDEEIEYLKTKQQERTELADKQHELELKNGIEMIKAETRKKLSRDEVEKMINASKLQDSHMSECRLKFISEVNKRDELKNDIEKFKLKLGNCIELQNHIANIGNLIKNSDENISKIKDDIISKSNDNFSLRLDPFIEKERKLKEKLTKLNDELMSQINLKLKHQKKNQQKK